MKTYIAILSILCSFSCKQEQTFQKEILGNWKSISVENLNGTYGIREFIFGIMYHLTELRLGFSEACDSRLSCSTKVEFLRNLAVLYLGEVQHL